MAVVGGPGPFDTSPLIEIGWEPLTPTFKVDGATDEG
jgi:hypothetical protein